jgi:two-component system LytT family response regulator
VVKRRAFIAEDEPLARRALRTLVDEVDWLECIGEAADGASAVRSIDTLRPELVFLDVHMPGLDGLEVLRRIRHKPEVVFTTAFDRYAVSAFELGALDYLVKPFGRARFQKMLERVRARTPSQVVVPPASERARDAIDAVPLRRVFTRRSGQIVPVALTSVVRLEARGDYVAIHCASGASLMHVPLSELETRLDPERFFRVHRSHIVNLDHVAAIRPSDDRRFSVVMDDGTEIIASRAASQRLRERLR